MRMATIRMLHHYVGLLIAPSVLFFALTGAYQLFALHEAHGAYQPPALIEKLGELHKNQRFALKPKRPGPPKPAVAQPANAPAAKDDDEDKTPLRVTVLKWLFLTVALGLAGSTAFGVYIGLSHPRRRGISFALLSIGVALPILICAL